MCYSTQLVLDIAQQFRGYLIDNSLLHNDINQ